MDTELDLFPSDQIVGTFRGFQEGGLEFHADLVLPYRNEFQNVPMHGQFLLVQLETPQEAVLGRITAFSAEGRLTSPSGEDFNIRAMRERRAVPDDLREDYLRYRVNMRVLGVVRVGADGASRPLTFVPSHRRLPHVGSHVAFPSGAVLRELASHHAPGATIGHLALGEYIYAREGNGFGREPWMQLRGPEVQVHFPVEHLVSRRSFVFARAGFGKSNLVKLLFSDLYCQTPTVEKRGGRRVPVGTLIFDPDGEYFWPDDKGRPGLSDVPALRDQLVVFTSREAPSAYYGSFVAGGIKLDIRRFPPADVIAIALGPERQEQQNVRKLAGLSASTWHALVDLVDREGNQADTRDIGKLLGLDMPAQEMEALAARSNMARIVSTLHDRSSQLMDLLMEALKDGKLCVVDVSQLRGAQSLVLSGLILRRIFDRNQQEFTSAESRTVPTIAVVEEAQTVLNERATSAEPYIAWVKEGRKYDLGAVLITQQPGSIPGEILSQGDNWFLFHLLSAADLVAAKRANAHFSDDILGVLLNEPIPGQGVFWSSVGGMAYPLPFRALAFERLYAAQDSEYCGSAILTYAGRLRAAHDLPITPRRDALPVAPADGHVSVTVATTAPPPEASLPLMETPPDEGGLDVFAVRKQQAIDGLRRDRATLDRIRQDGVPWGALNKVLLAHLPANMDGAADVAYRLVPEALDQIFGHGSWRTFKAGAQGRTTFVRVTTGAVDDTAF